ncbi:cupin domain-containing protein [Halpernia frigidisoli]|uniref:Cupin domain-containing protein n=1 Tax=Halpernia frigidisoli TaxID=1125876 RepID=A0A1I3IX32_9FLAO|nr:cupin domain-containing protein [Halpernia frigidisoli]SFI52415.1 Cupin domain-containing protein [Halpernia frigidisoli]
MFLESKNYNWEKVDENLDRAVVAFDDSLMQTIVKFKKGGIGKLHNHIHSQVAYIESGSFEVQIEDYKKVLTKGDTFFLKSNVTHGVVCLEEGILIESFSPMRKDFVK